MTSKSVPNLDTTPRETVIHPTAIVAETAEIGAGCHIGPYSVIGAQVKLGQNVTLHSHVVVEGDTWIGDGCEVFPFASIGHVCQDLKFHGEESRLRIGKNNKIREYVTLQGGTADGRTETTIGDNCLFMASAHVAHDCVVGNGVIMANNAVIAGHVTLEDFVIIGGNSAVHQFVRIGRQAMIGGMAGVEHDLIPYGLVKGSRGDLVGLNIIGMQRRGMSRETISELRGVYKDIFEKDDVPMAQRIARLVDTGSNDDAVNEFLKFVGVQSDRALFSPQK